MAKEITLYYIFRKLVISFILFQVPFSGVRQKWAVGPIDKMTTDISVVRGGWDPTLQQEIVDEYEYDGGNSSSRLFERSRIKALAGTKIRRFTDTLKFNNLAIS